MQLHLVSSDGTSGCMLSKGTWAATGPSITCAGYTIQADPTKLGSFVLHTSKGVCAVQDQELLCDTSVVEPTLFQSVSRLPLRFTSIRLTTHRRLFHWQVQTGSGHVLSYKGSTGFSSSTVASGMTQVNVSVKDNGKHKFSLAIVPS